MHHYPWDQVIADDPPFNPALHLALDKPDSFVTMAELGYPTGTEFSPSKIAATGCFRVLTDEGAATLLHVCRQLEAFTTANPRIARNTRGGIYRSGFLRDLALSAEVTAHCAELLDAAIEPHGMGHQLAHLNYTPPNVGDNVDKWHVDTLQVDYIMFVTDPTRLDGGEFQYFAGTTEQMRRLKASQASIPAERIIAPTIPGPGYAVLMQGEHVVHQAKGLRSAGERITLVNGYWWRERKDYTALSQLLHADPESVTIAEYARHMSIRAQHQLAPLIDKPDFEAGREQALSQLAKAREELTQAMDAIRQLAAEPMRHFGD